MSSLSISDVKQQLRKLEFPHSAKEALIKIALLYKFTEQMLSGRGAPSNKQLDVVMDLIAEFVFGETERRDRRRGSGLHPLQELQLINVICLYLSGNISETTKNTIFLSLFGGMESQRRLRTLSILASMAMSASSTPMLLAVGVWLQQMGCSSPQSLQLVENVIRDHFVLQSSNRAALKSLATSAPQFVANFIAAATELYTHDGQGNGKLPPKNLLEVITSWVYSNPSLCMSAQLNPAALPSGAIAMAAVTPLAGLVRWCALAPLHLQDTEPSETPPLKKIKLEEEKKHSIISQAVSKPLTESELYIKLHLGVLHSLRAGKRTHGAVNAQQLAALAPPVLGFAQRLADSRASAREDDRLQECLDRIGQAIQVALANGCVYGNVSHLLGALASLPENRLLRIVVRTQQAAI